MYLCWRCIGTQLRNAYHVKYVWQGKLEKNMIPTSQLIEHPSPAKEENDECEAYIGDICPFQCILYRSCVFGRYQLQVPVRTGKTAPLLPVIRPCPDGQKCYWRADQGVQKADFLLKAVIGSKLLTIIYLWL